jgi:hypothetical protein
LIIERGLLMEMTPENRQEEEGGRMTPDFSKMLEEE